MTSKHLKWRDNTERTPEIRKFYSKDLSVYYIYSKFGNWFIHSWQVREEIFNKNINWFVKTIEQNDSKLSERFMVTPIMTMHDIEFIYEWDEAVMRNDFSLIAQQRTSWMPLKISIWLKLSRNRCTSY